MALTLIIEVLNVTIEVVREQTLGIVFRGIGYLRNRIQDFIYGVHSSDADLISNLEADEPASQKSTGDEQSSG